MTEREWLTSNDSTRMLEFARTTSQFRSLYESCNLHLATVLMAYKFVPTDMMADFIRDVYGNPYRQVALCGQWLGGINSCLTCPECEELRSWNHGTLRRIAESILIGYRFEEMPVLADALEDAGCDCQVILDHCRNQEKVPNCGVPGNDLECVACSVKLYGNDANEVCQHKQGSHVYGCWVLRLIVGDIT